MAGRVPYGEFGSVPVDVEGFDFEIDSDGRRLFRVECVVGETKKQTGEEEEEGKDVIRFKSGLYISLCRSICDRRTDRPSVCVGLRQSRVNFLLVGVKQYRVCLLLFTGIPYNA